MGHYVLNHVVIGIAATAVGLFIGFYLLYRIANWAFPRFQQRWHMRELSDWAAVPMLFLIFSILDSFRNRSAALSAGNLNTTPIFMVWKSRTESIPIRRKPPRMPFRCWASCHCRTHIPVTFLCSGTLIIRRFAIAFLLLTIMIRGAKASSPNMLSGRHEYAKSEAVEFASRCKEAVSMTKRRPSDEAAADYVRWQLQSRRFCGPSVKSHSKSNRYTQFETHRSNHQGCT